MIPNETSKPIVASGGHMRTGSYDVHGVALHNASFHSNTGASSHHIKKKSVSNISNNNILQTYSSTGGQSHFHHQVSNGPSANTTII